MEYVHPVYNAFHISDKIEVRYFSCLVYKRGLLIICHGEKCNTPETRNEVLNPSFFDHFKRWSDDA